MELDPYQDRAAAEPARHLRILAGAGSGKTRTLVARVHQLLNQGVLPERILVVTFSRKAAEELKERLGGDTGVAVSTLHALGYSILRSMNTGWSVAEGGKKNWLIRKALQETRAPIKFGQVSRALSKAKTSYCPLDLQVLYCSYERFRRAAKLYDFDDMLVEAEEALRTSSAVRARWQCWDHVLVDEVQDTSTLQWAMLWHLMDAETSLCAVGDAAQAIYGFRGAQPQEFLTGLEQRFPDLQTVELPRNYRSVPEVVEIANGVATEQPGGLQLVSARKDPGVVEYWPPTGGEPERVVDELQKLHGRYRWRDLAILYRTNAQAERFETRLIRAQIPYEIAGDWSFYSRREIKDVLAYLRLAQDWEQESAERVCNRPSRYLGAAYLREVAGQGGWYRAPGMTFSRSYMDRGHADFVAVVGKMQELHGRGLTPVELLRYVYEDVGYRRYLLGESPDQDDEVRDENLAILLEAADGYRDVASLLAMASKCERHQRGQPRDRDQDGKVQLLTVHRAKGLEWPVVFFVGVDQDVLPHKCATDEAEEGRIFYVGITRARDRLIVSSYRLRSPYVRFLEGFCDEAGLSVAGDMLQDRAPVDPDDAGGPRAVGDDDGDYAVGNSQPADDGVGVCESTYRLRQGAGVA